MKWILSLVSQTSSEFPREGQSMSTNKHNIPVCGRNPALGKDFRRKCCGSQSTGLCGQRQPVTSEKLRLCCRLSESYGGTIPYWQHDKASLVPVVESHCPKSHRPKSRCPNVSHASHRGSFDFGGAARKSRTGPSPDRNASQRIPAICYPPVDQLL